jgi:hypothetical protein
VFTYVYSRYALCLLLQILLAAALDIKTRDERTDSAKNLSAVTYCKASHFFANFYLPGVGWGEASTLRFAPVVPRAKAGPASVFRAEKMLLT